MLRFCWLLLLALPTFVVAGPARIGGDPLRDVRQTIQARKLLADDPDLAMWNIGVTVRDRVATLWGPVSSAEVAFRAEICLKTMIELTEVRNELFISELVRPMRVPLKIDNPPGAIPNDLPPIPGSLQPSPEQPRQSPPRLPPQLPPSPPRLFQPVPDRSPQQDAPALPPLRRLPSSIRFESP
jgi:hypothetical protein